ncbi:MAG: sporulation protein YtxC [Bacillota bacterium]
MNPTVSVGATKNVDVLRDRLYSGSQNLQKRGVKLVLSTREAGNITFLGCNLIPLDRVTKTAEPQALILRQYLARTVAELITTDWEKILLSKMIDHQKDLFTPVERKQILERAERFLELTDGIAGFGTSEKAGSSKGNSNRRNLIRQAVLEYLEANDELVIDGFLRFRLKHYLDQLSQAVDSAIDELMMEREYQEFIRLLRYFVEIQEPRANQVHVVMRPTGIFHIYDSHGHPVEHDYLNGFLLDVVETDLNYEDLLISALITIAPQQITIHLAEASQIGESVETIQEVFDGRVIVCPGCEHCLRYNKL